MTIVLLTGPGLAHRYMANRLAAELSLTAIVVDDGRPRTVRGELSRLLRKYTPGEIASMLDLPRGTVNSRLRRGLDSLRETLP